LFIEGSRLVVELPAANVLERGEFAV
jgi:hypothetical protein